jgi:hypothetical protein
MPSSEGYEERISRFGWRELSTLWEKVKSDSTPDWPGGRALEYLILRAFQLAGAQITWPYEVREEGRVLEQIDGALHSRGLHCLVESKDWGTSVNIEPIAKLRNQLRRRPAGTIGVVFSRGGFTSAAVKLAQYTVHEGILLWTGREIEYVLHNENILDALERKYRACVEMADPYFSADAEEVP